MSEESKKTQAEKKQLDKTSAKRRDASFEIMLDGKTCGVPLSRETLESLSRRLSENMSLYYSQHTDEYIRMCDEGIMKPTCDNFNDAEKDADDL